MKIINTSIPSINTYNPSNPTITWSKNLTAGALELQNNSSFEIEAWYCLFSCEHSFKIYSITELIDSDTLKKIIFVFKKHNFSKYCFPHSLGSAPI
jgi:hypothetical protein